MSGMNYYGYKSTSNKRKKYICFISHCSRRNINYLNKKIIEFM